MSLGPEEDVNRILGSAKTIAIVGLSEKAGRPSFGVAKYLQKYFTVVPVNPNLSHWEGLKCFPSILSIPSEIQVDIIDIFRASDAVPEIVDEAIARGGVRLLWMQEGVSHDPAKRRAEDAGIRVVMDSCLAVIHSQARSR